MHGGDPGRHHNGTPIPVGEQEREQRKNPEVKLGHSHCLVNMQCAKHHQCSCHRQPRRQCTGITDDQHRRDQCSWDTDQKGQIQGVIPPGKGKGQYRQSPQYAEHQPVCANVCLPQKGISVFHRFASSNPLAATPVRAPGPVACFVARRH